MAPPHSRDAILSSLNRFLTSPRFSSLRRPYTAQQLLSKVGSNPAHLYSRPSPGAKLHALLLHALRTGEPIRTMGAIDPVQISQYVRAGIKVGYVSGWATSATGVYPVGVNPGPDVADYPYTSVPAVVERLQRALRAMDRREWFEVVNGEKKEEEWVDYNVPLFADMDSGHGGLASIMKLATLFADSGVAGVHIEDQLHGVKKCGRQGGKVVVPVEEMIERLVGARMAWDIMGAETVCVARTDCCDASLISEDGGASDAEFIEGVIVEEGESTLREEVDRAMRERGVSKGVEEKWLEGKKLITIDEAAESILPSDKYASYQSTISQTPSTIRQRHLLASSLLGRPLPWSHTHPRTREGFYRYRGGLSALKKRIIAFGPYVDGVWAETAKPSVAEAREYARAFRSVKGNEEKFLTYNLSPSFNWSAHGFSDGEMESFIPEIGKEGFALQLVSLAGLHLDALGANVLAKSYLKEGMKAYTELIQRKEKDEGVDVLKHQKWSGAKLMDETLMDIQGSSERSSMGAASTESQFD
ncbi:isocitrate lyase and phosphorylmutase [Atractiella rhizophila]|nr:isocitrate lyase and phosphorylmutase [Atractiella rhizophila]